MATRSISVAVLAIVALEAAALACDCAAPPEGASSAYLRKEAAENMGPAVALVEIEAVTSYSSTSGEVARVIRVLGGNAPSQFRIYRSASADSSGSCDSTYRAGSRDVVLLYPSDGADPDALPTMPISGACMSFWLEEAAFRDEVIKRLGGPPRGSERG
jgi:hypothetical protein